MNEQLQMEFPGLQEAAAATTRIKRRRQAIASTPPDAFLVMLNSALTQENITFTTYALLLAVHSSGGSIPLTALSRMVGTSYWTTRKQIERTQWFMFHREAPLVSISLTPEAEIKLTRVARRLKSK